MSKITVMIVDDHPVVRDGLKLAIDSQPDLTVAGEAADGLEALKKAPLLSPDVIILDLVMPRMGGIEAATLLHGALPQTVVVIYSPHSKEVYVHQALRAGALGFVLKEAPVAEMPEALRTVRHGDYYLSPRINAAVIDLYLKKSRRKTPLQAYDELSEREGQVFRLLTEGYSTVKLARMLSISPKTVEKHRVNIMRKIGVDNPVELVRYALRIGVIDPELWLN